jgi:serine/threonine protein kinase
MVIAFCSDKLLIITLLLSFSSGAFSNVYKARDRKTGQKVAIKVVRKYELNSNQVSNVVSCLFFFPLWRAYEVDGQ